MKEAIVSYLIDLLREFSTWHGIAALMATGGMLIAPAQLDAVYKDVHRRAGSGGGVHARAEESIGARGVGSFATAWAMRSSPSRV
ncbi:MAG: hypothetical protein ABMA14_15010 [Hyphomonadaceae bacterium]